MRTAEPVHMHIVIASRKLLHINFYNEADNLGLAYPSELEVTHKKSLQNKSEQLRTEIETNERSVGHFYKMSHP